MRRASFVGLIGVLAMACQVDDRATKERLDKMIAQADQLEKRVDGLARAGAAAPAAPAPRPGRPDPTAVYSVPLDGSPVSGPATAKVTIVEVGEFA